MRVLMVTPDYPPMGGGIQLLCQRLARHSRYDWEVVCVGRGKRACAGDGTVRETRTPRLPSHAASVAALNVAAVVRALARRPSAIVSGHIVAAPAVFGAQRLLGTATLQILHAKELGRRPSLTKIATQHALATMAVSSYTRDLAVSLGAPAERLYVIHPGVDAPPAESVGGPCDSRTGPPTVVTVARLEDRYKGFDVMLRAMPLIRAKIPDVRWVVVGEGSLRAELQATAAAFGVSESVTFTGALSDSDRDAWLDRAHLFAMPSRLLPGGTGGEGFGIVYLEAGAHRLPVVAGNVGGAVDAVRDGKTGLLVDPTDHIAVAGAITRLLTERDLARALGEAGRRRAETQTWQRMAAEVDDLLERLVGRATPSPRYANMRSGGGRSRMPRDEREGDG